MDKNYTIHMAKKRAGSKKARKEETLEEKIKRITKEELKKAEKNAKKRAKKTDKLLKDVDRIVMPDEARKKASQNKEAGGKLDIYKVEEKGEKIAILKPRIEEEYTEKREKEKVKFDLEKMEEIEPFKLEEKKESGFGTVHTHPGSSSELSKADKESAILSGSPVLAISDVEKEGKMAYLNSKGKLKEKNVHSMSKKEIKKLLKK